MKETGLLFSAPMVRALLARTKTQTRRIVKPQPDVVPDLLPTTTAASSVFRIPVKGQSGTYDHLGLQNFTERCPYGKPGDRLWVRETIRLVERWHDGRDDRCRSVYCADDKDTPADGWPWKRDVLPSIHCPRGLSRITLDLTAVRVERLQDISEDDAKAEGAEFHDGRGVGHSGFRHDASLGFVYPTARESFFALWESLNGAESLRANPWLWALTFPKVA
jgi:hypothetical protein